MILEYQNLVNPNRDHFEENKHHRANILSLYLHLYGFRKPLGAKSCWDGNGNLLSSIEMKFKNNLKHLGIVEHTYDRNPRTTLANTH